MRALLISYHFPPSNAAGAHRWDAFTRYGAARGWSFDVLTAAGSASSEPHGASDASGRAIRTWHVPHTTPALVRAVREGRRQYSRAVRSVSSPQAATASAASATATASPTATAPTTAPAPATIGTQVLDRSEMGTGVSPSVRARRAVNAWLLHREHSSWVPDVVSRGLEVAKATTFDCVISSGPPHMSHEAARRLARALRVPLILDFRDPWSLMDTLLEFVASPMWYRIAAAHERRCVAEASLVVMNTELATAQMRLAYPDSTLVTVRNGYDGERVAAKHDEHLFRLVYAGGIYLDRDPRPILAAVARVVKSLALTPKDIELVFVGDCESYGGTRLVDLAAREGLDGFVQVLPQIPRAQLRERLASAAMLVNLPQGAKLCVPSKVYEYLHFPAWVLALEPEDSATALVLHDTGADVVSPGDIDAIAAVVSGRFREYASGVRPQPIAQDERFSVASQAKLFYEQVARVLGR